MKTTHYAEPIREGSLFMPICGTDDNGNCYLTEKKEEVTCKRCLKKIAQNTSKEKRE